MSRAPEGWDFVKVGGIYQYKEDWFIGIVEVLEDNSTDEYYSFKLNVLQSTHELSIFDVSYKKEEKGYYSGMSQFYDYPEYVMLPLGTPWKYDYIKDDPEKMKLVNEFMNREYKF